MLPTPDTSHVPYSRVYEPSEDSYLLLDTLSAPSETQFLHSRFGPSNHAAPLVLEVGTGSGVVIAFVTAQASHLFGTRSILTAGVDMNAFACRGTNDTVTKAQRDQENSATSAREGWLGATMGDLTTAVRPGSVDVLVFNPPYVPSEELPVPPPAVGKPTASAGSGHDDVLRSVGSERKPTFDEDSYLLALSYAGGHEGMETTTRLIESLPEVLSARGCAYVLLCAQNKPDEVRSKVLALGSDWRVATVGTSGKTAGWEKLQIVRIWREIS